MMVKSGNYALRKKGARTKETEINELLSKPDIDLWKLRDICLTEGGLVNDTCRKKAWPKLVGLNASESVDEITVASVRNKTKKGNLTDEISELVEVVDPSSITTKGFKNQIMAKCLDFRQIEQDTARCSWHLLSGSQRSRRRQMRNKHRKKIANLLKRKQRRLENLINLVLIQSYGNIEDSYEKLRYYQGYHDIASIFLSALGGTAFTKPLMLETYESENESKLLATAAGKTAQAMGLDLPSKVLLQVSYSHLPDAMKSNFEVLSSALRLMIMPLIGVFDSEVHAHLYDCDMEPFFALSWIITWFSHDVRDTSLVKRLFDFFIASHPLMPVYMSIAMVLHPYNRLEVLGADCDFACVHNTLAQLPRNSCNVGWKLIGGPFETDYVSGDEGDDDDLMSIDGASVISHDGEVEFWEDEGSFAPSLASSTVGSNDGTRAPFEELIEMSIEYMRRIPPRNLVKLARRYFQNENAQQLLSVSSSIALLQPPPQWALANTVSSDWILRKQAKEQARTARIKLVTCKTRKMQEENKSNNDKESLEPLIRDMKQAQDHKTIYKVGQTVRVIVAAGIGPDGEKEDRQARRKRKLLIYSTMVVAIAIGWKNKQNISNLSPSMFERKVDQADGYVEESPSDRNLNLSDQKSDEYIQETDPNSSLHFKEIKQNDSIMPMQKEEQNIKKNDIFSFLDFKETAKPDSSILEQKEERDTKKNDIFSFLDFKETTKSDSSVSENIIAESMSIQEEKVTVNAPVVPQRTEVVSPIESLSETIVHAEEEKADALDALQRNEKGITLHDEDDELTKFFQLTLDTVETQVAHIIQGLQVAIESTIQKCHSAIIEQQNIPGFHYTKTIVGCLGTQIVTLVYTVSTSMLKKQKKKVSRLRPFRFIRKFRTAARNFLVNEAEDIIF